MTNKDASNSLEHMLSSLAATLPLVQRLIPSDVMFALTDQEKFIYYLPGEKLDIGLKLGAPIPPTGGIRKALDTNSMITVSVPEEVYGYPFKSISMPLHNEHQQCFGILTMGISLHNQLTLEGAAEKLADSSSEIRELSDGIAGAANTLMSEVHVLNELGGQVLTELERADSMLRFIRSIADNSRLLGINAAIEAAHAGEAGRGFGIVAKEIRTMADSSSTTSSEVEEMLTSIHSHIHELRVKLTACSELSGNQAAGTEEIAASMQQLAAYAENIRDIAKRI
ncbi:methyl-accepting chemotaxis protein [Paenibacillus massiliensis]|uniref:methyl-accepting chemotaxis protein n=1 Tax=Paenibacillus massiliensis TaxID=225917 RepID=UPI00040661B2|nr:methyl-accepting chemotaxis protein [Paenibacillus massiliensis]